jgi:RNase P/RNase MRP subunit POP5
MAKKNAVKQQQQLIDQDVKDVLGDTGLAQTNSILRTLNDINKKNAILVAKYVKEQAIQGFL